MLKSGLKQWAWRCLHGSTGLRQRVLQVVRVNQQPTWIELAGYFPHLITNGKPSRQAIRHLLQIGAVDLEPQSAWALPIKQNAGFG